MRRRDVHRGSKGRRPSSAAERRRRRGVPETLQCSNLTFAEVDLLRELAEEGGWTVSRVIASLLRDALKLHARGARLLQEAREAMEGPVELTPPGEQDRHRVDLSFDPEGHGPRPHPRLDEMHDENLDAQNRMVAAVERLACAMEGIAVALERFGTAFFAPKCDEPTPAEDSSEEVTDA